MSTNYDLNGAGNFSCRDWRTRADQVLPETFCFAQSVQNLGVLSFVAVVNNKLDLDVPVQLEVDDTTQRSSCFWSKQDSEHNIEQDLQIKFNDSHALDS